MDCGIVPELPVITPTESAMPVHSVEEFQPEEGLDATFLDDETPRPLSTTTNHVGAKQSVSTDRSVF